MAEGTQTPDNPLATVGLVLAIVATGLLILPVMHLVICTGAVVCCAIALRREAKRTLAMVGLLLGMLPFVVFWGYSLGMFDVPQ